MSPALKKFVKTRLSDRNIELSGGIFACVASILIFLTTLHTKIYIESPIVSTTIPRIVCYLMFFIGIFMIVSWFIKLKKGMLKDSANDIKAKENDPDLNDLFSKITPFCSFIFLTLYVAMMKPFGFIIASALYLTVQIPLLSVDLSLKSFIKSFIIGIITGIVVFLIFNTGFGLRLPKNVFGF